MKNKQKIILIALTLVAISARSTIAGSPDDRSVTVSIPSLNLSGSERVVGFDIHVHSGRIARLADLPIGWEICVTNDPSWNTRVEASCSVGAAALGREFFKNFMAIEKHSPLGAPFGVEGEVIVTEDFATERRITVPFSQFETSKAKSK